MTKLFGPDDNCTIAGATGAATVDGRCVIGSNSDDPFTTRTRLVVVEPSDGERFVATQIVSPSNGSPVSFDRMHTRGINARGLAYTWSAVRPDPEHEPDSESAFGLPFYQFGRLLLSQSRSVEDAIGILDSYPRAIHGNYLFGDAKGEVALVEVSTQSMNVGLGPTPAGSDGPITGPIRRCRQSGTSRMPATRRPSGTRGSRLSWPRETGASIPPSLRDA